MACFSRGCGLGTRLWNLAGDGIFWALDKTLLNTEDLVFDPNLHFPFLEKSNGKAQELMQTLLNVEHFLLLSVHRPKLSWDERKLEVELQKLDRFFPGFSQKVYEKLQTAHPDLALSEIKKEAWRENSSDPEGPNWASERLVAFRMIAERELIDFFKLEPSEISFIHRFNAEALETPARKDSESSHYFPVISTILNGVLAHREEGSYQELYTSTWGKTDLEKAQQISLSAREWSSIGEKAPQLVKAFISADSMIRNVQRESCLVKPSREQWEACLQSIIESSEDLISWEFLTNRLPRIAGEEADAIDWNHPETPRTLRGNLEDSALKWLEEKFAGVSCVDVDHRIYELAKDAFKERIPDFGRIHRFRDFYTFFLAVEVAARKAEEEELVCEKTSSYTPTEEKFTEEADYLEDSYAGTNAQLVALYSPLHNLMTALNLSEGDQDSLPDSKDFLDLLDSFPIPGFTDRIVQKIASEFRTNGDIVRHNLSSHLFRKSFIRAVNLAIGNHLVMDGHITRRELTTMQEDVYLRSDDPARELNPEYGAHNLVNQGVEALYYHIDEIHSLRVKTFDEAKAQLASESAKEWSHIEEDASGLVYNAMKLQSLTIDASNAVAISKDEWWEPLEAIKKASGDTIQLKALLSGLITTDEEGDTSIDWDHPEFSSRVRENLSHCLFEWLEKNHPDVPRENVFEMVYHLSKDPFKEQDPHFGEKNCFRDLPTFFLAVELCARQKTDEEDEFNYRGSWTPPPPINVPDEVNYRSKDLNLLFNPLRALKSAIDSRTLIDSDEDSTATEEEACYASSLQLQETLASIPIENFKEQVIAIIASEFRCEPKLVEENLAQPMFFNCLERAVSLTLGQFLVDQDHLNFRELEQLREMIYEESSYEHKEKEPDYGSTHFFDFSVESLYECISEIRLKRPIPSADPAHVDGEGSAAGIADPSNSDTA